MSPHPLGDPHRGRRPRTERAVLTTSVTVLLLATALLGCQQTPPVLPPPTHAAIVKEHVLTHLESAEPSRADLAAFTVASREATSPTDLLAAWMSVPGLSSESPTALRFAFDDAVEEAPGLTDSDFVAGTRAAVAEFTEAPE